MKPAVVTSFVIVCLVIIAASPAVTCAEPPRYRWQPNAQFVYQVRITADTPLETEIMSGHIVYDVVSAGEPLRVKYKGGLTKTTKTKPGAATGPRGGPLARDPFGPAGGNPFARRVNPFQGLEQTTNEISLKPSGEILAVTGSSQLPYLLGNLSLLPFEPLPDADQKSWNVEGGILITEKGEQRGRGNFFDPFAARGGNTQDKQSAGGQSTSFTFVSETDGLAVFERSYRLNSPADGKSLTIDGSGRWTFNRQLGMSESLDFKQTLRIKLNNVKIAVPVEIKYERVPAEAWAKLESDRLAREDALRRMAEQQTAEAKAAAEAPIVGDERTRVLAALRSTDPASLAETLNNLSKKSPRDDAELAQAIQPLLKHSDTKVQASGRAALAAFSSAYKRVYDLNRAYARSYEVKQVGLWITHDTPLPAGLIVAANSFNYSETQYFPATVVEPLANGLVKVKYQDRGSFTEERLREDMFLPPPEVEQPNLTQEQIASLRAYEAEVRRSIGDSAELETLIRAYRDGKQPVPKVGEPLPAGVTLPKFLVVAAKRDNQWYQAHISGELPDGRVSLRFSGERFDAKLPRADLRLPPSEVKQPNVDSPFDTTTPAAVSSATAASQFRTWTDASGAFQIEARLIEHLGESVRLVRKDGKEIVVPLARLSEADRQYAATATKAENPFER
jgi:hypothetical protein